MKDHPNPQQRRALVVLAPPCAGASAVAGALGLAGAAWPAHLTAPTETHPRGAWQSDAIAAIAEEALAGAGLKAHLPGAVGPDFARSAEAAALSRRLADVLTSEFGNADLALINDPRLARLVPLLENALEHVGMAPQYVLVQRHPLDVAASLHRHARIEHGRGLRLWLEHVVAAEHGTRGHPRRIVDYDALLDDWRTVLQGLADTFGFTWPTDPDGRAADVGAFLELGLRHHHARVRGELTSALAGTHLGAVRRACEGAPEADAGFAAACDAADHWLRDAAYTDSGPESNPAWLGCALQACRQEVDDVLAAASVTEGREAEWRRIARERDRALRAVRVDLDREARAHGERIAERNDRIHELKTRIAELEARTEADAQAVGDRRSSSRLRRLLPRKLRRGGGLP